MFFIQSGFRSRLEVDEQASATFLQTQELLRRPWRWSTDTSRSGGTSRTYTEPPRTHPLTPPDALTVSPACGWESGCHSVADSNVRAVGSSTAGGRGDPWSRPPCSVIDAHTAFPPRSPRSHAFCNPPPSPYVGRLSSDMSSTLYAICIFFFFSHCRFGAGIF